MTTKGHRTNGRIRVPEIMLIPLEGEGSPRVIRTDEARRMATDLGLDLVEVAPNQSPPVCRILDYGKFRYALSKKEKLARRNSGASNQLREIRVTPQISPNDLASKMSSVRNMLGDGSKVKVTVILRGRLGLRPAMGFELLERVQTDMEDISKVDRDPVHEKRAVAMILAPLAGVAKRRQHANGDNGAGQASN